MGWVDYRIEIFSLYYIHCWMFINGLECFIFSNKASLCPYSDSPRKSHWYFHKKIMCRAVLNAWDLAKFMFGMFKGFWHNILLVYILWLFLATLAIWTYMFCLPLAAPLEGLVTVSSSAARRLEWQTSWRKNVWPFLSPHPYIQWTFSIGGYSRSIPNISWRTVLAMNTVWWFEIRKGGCVGMQRLIIIHFSEVYLYSNWPPRTKGWQNTEIWNTSSPNQNLIVFRPGAPQKYTRSLLIP